MKTNINRLKIFTVLGTRPEIIRLSETIKLVDKFFDQVLVHTGQNYDKNLNEVFFKDFDLRKPDHYLDATAKTAVSTIGNILISIEKIIKKEAPDAFLILGDTNSALSSYVAKRHKIPIFHIEGGNRSFDQRVPEEINRKIVDHLADIHITYSTISRDYLVREGIPPETIIKLGSPMKEVLNANMHNINSSQILKKIKIKKNDYILISIHREENLDADNKLKEIIKSLDLIYETFKKQMVISLHPRTREKIKNLKIKLNEDFFTSKPFKFSDYIRLQMDSFLVLSDSGTINEEASILNFKAINIRDSYERPESAEEASTILSSVNHLDILRACNLAVLNERNSLKIVQDYNVDNFALKFCRIIQGHIGYVNRNVWKKY